MLILNSINKLLVLRGRMKTVSIYLVLYCYKYFFLKQNLFQNDKLNHEIFFYFRKLVHYETDKLQCNNFKDLF